MVQIRPETYIFIFTFSLRSRSLHLGETHAKEIKHDIDLEKNDFIKYDGVAKR